ncbi:MAG: sugar phosphate isomerase/epimerase family protein [Phycisphaeraceae bacterium]
MRSINRRVFLASTAAALPLAYLPGCKSTSQDTSATLSVSGARTGNPIAVSTYSFWRFGKAGRRATVLESIEQAGAMGFDGVEVLEVQMGDDNGLAAKRAIKQAALLDGLPLIGLSTHQGFVSPDADKRQANIERTTRSLELAYDLGIPTMRVNTGRWGTSPNFDTLMANNGIEPTLEGYTDDQGFAWVIDAYGKLADEAAKRGVVMGLENHWGLGRTASGVMRVVNAVNSPWLRTTLDTGNSLTDQYTEYEALANDAVLVQAKTYFGGGIWYTLDIDYERVAKILKAANYKGFISVEFEGKEDWKTGVPKSLAVMREVFVA